MEKQGKHFKFHYGYYDDLHPDIGDTWQKAKGQGLKYWRWALGPRRWKAGKPGTEPLARA